MNSDMSNIRTFKSIFSAVFKYINCYCMYIGIQMTKETKRFTKLPMLAAKGHSLAKQKAKKMLFCGGGFPPLRVL